MNKQIKIGNKLVGEGANCFCVAEMSGNHNHDYSRAVEIIHAAKESGADAIKLQTYTADSLSVNCDNKYFRITDGIWKGMTEYELYKEASTPWDWQQQLKEEAEKIGLICFSSPFDSASLDFMMTLNMPAIKIASYEINDVQLIRQAAKQNKPIILATGVAEIDDIDLAIKICKEENNNDVILLKCVSAYPTPYEDINLASIPTLARKYDCILGLSDHSMGSTVPVGAAALGIKMIEKHLTLKRSDGGPDSAFSMEPDEFKKMVDDIRIIEKSIGSSEYKLTELQKKERGGSRSLFVVQDIKAGETITTQNVRSIRPNAGLHTMYYEEVIGKTVIKDVPMGTPLTWDIIKQ